MTKLLLTSVAALATGLAMASGTALAADLYQPAPLYKAPPMPAPIYSWTGCYLDGGIGYGLWNENHTLPGTGTTWSTSGGDGWLGRLGAGCDYQINSSFVVGAFGDYDFMHLHGTFADPVLGGGVAGGQTEHWSWAAGGRLGYLVTPALLAYVDGGYTQAHFGGIMFAPAVGGTAVDFTSANTYQGWFVGGGTEYALNLGWLPRGLFWRTEYRFADYNSATLPVFAVGGAATGLSEHIHPYDQTVTSGLAWRFNFGSSRY